ncbi:WW domain-binding protein 4-like isoform X2 [Daphnia pulex]|uniref:WW domain-binding protein 4-like isoform X1 n=1 Tax=Daphnia pulex TaxID=6669 RepID=UPI001EDFCAB5|nr:WW domain-binding protein 4-like isoform X1 [Daphnia pulex]XP_046458332.1 WW domain-binding protein 4-like isoform X2 [Daphnia pulex]
MTEYWKSLPKKYCDFCKCWITDNKASVQFHERGEGHKAQVARRLTELTRKGEIEYRQQQQVNTDLQRMEEAALRAYHKDLTSNPDLSARSMASQHSHVAKVIEKAAANPKSLMSGEAAALQAAANFVGCGPGPSMPLLPAPKVWHEALSPEGYSYYWNVETNETCWEAPAEGFVTLMEQQLEELKNATTDTKETSAEPVITKKKKKKKKKKEMEEEFYEDYEEEFQGEEEAAAESAAANPYGQWETVQKAAEPAPPVNLQLPKINFSNAAKAAAAIVVPAEPRIRFTEKTAAPSSSGLIGSLIKREPGESEFKKRKIGEEGVKKNLRTRESNDE